MSGEDAKTFEVIIIGGGLRIDCRTYTARARLRTLFDRNRSLRRSDDHTELDRELSWLPQGISGPNWAALMGEQANGLGWRRSDEVLEVTVEGIGSR